MLRNWELFAAASFLGWGGAFGLGIVGMRAGGGYELSLLLLCVRFYVGARRRCW